ncbi:MAG: cadherin-like beta sandwich domain-containing protein [Oscillospiraceae bacterium]|nr:cadherin-like beta sandwich domain-containing protein [Oscillospiraceae bacterium]
MKKIISIILSVMLLLCIAPISVFAASGSVSVSKTSISMDKGTTTTFTITATNAAGKILISSSNPNVAKVDKTQVWLDSVLGTPSATVTVTAVGTGSATINVVLDDVADDDGNDISGGTKTVQVNVQAPTTKTTTTTTKAATTTTKATTTAKATTTEAPYVDANLKSLKITGYTLKPSFSPDRTSYTVTVPEDISSLDVNATALKSNAKVEIFGAEKFTAGKSATMRIVVTAADGKTKTYTIKTVIASEETTEAELSTDKATVGLETLSVLAVKDVTPELVPGVAEYTVSVPTGTNALTVDAKGSEVDGATVDIEGADNLVASNNTVTITVTAKDGTKTVYTLHVVFDETNSVIENNPTQIVEKSGVPVWLVIILALILLIVGLVLGFLFGKKKGGNDDGPDDDNGGSGFVFGNANDEPEDKLEAEEKSSADMFGSSGMNFNPPSFGGFTPIFEETAAFNPDAAPSLNQPVYTQPVAEPVVPVAPVAPINEAPVAAPLYTPPVSEPVAEPVVPVAPVAPVNEAPVAAPLYTPPVSEPVAEPVVPVAPVAPVIEAPVAAPVYEAPVAEPVPQPAIPVAPAAEPVAEPEPITINPFEQSYVAPKLPYEPGATITDESVAYTPPQPVTRSPFGF